MVKIFIANRGEIACRIAATADKMKIGTCGVFTPQDERSKHTRVLQQIRRLPSGDLSENYLNQELLIEIALEFDADAIHPGYGFLSENPAFAQKVIAAGLTWIGPSPESMRRLGDKVAAKEIAAQAGVPVPPWIRLDGNAEPAKVVREFGLPLLIKAAHGGGGRGQRIVRAESEFEEALRAAKSEAQRSFGSPEVFIEKFLEEPRHIEVQILADQHGNVFALGERDCTLQRRNQKLIEETPASIDDAARKELHESARALATTAGYTNAGTIEFLAQKTSGGKWEFYFMELNARLQVEHPVTEMVTGLDLVELQIRAARGENLRSRLQKVKFKGHAMELRLCAENPSNNFLPTPGPLTLLRFPEREGLRVDSGYEAGDVIPQEYDSLFAKLILHGLSRREVIDRFSTILENTLVAGTITNKFYLQRVLNHEDFQENRIHTRWIESHVELAQEDSVDLDEDLILWGKKWSSDLLVQRNSDSAKGTVPAAILIAFVPDEDVHGSASPRGVCVAGHFETNDGTTVYGAGWVNRFELCVTFQHPIHGVGQRRLSFAAKFEIEDLRTHHGPIVAQVPGVVLEIRVKPQQIVEALQPILIVEAMKIEMPFTLPIEARITGIHVKSGDRIMPGQTLVTWEPAS